MAKKPTQTRRSPEFAGETYVRDLAFRADDIDEKARTASIAFSSEAPVERWGGTEILDHTPKAVRLGRLKNGGALLLNHSPDKQIGVIESAQIDTADKVGRATVRFSRSALGEEIFQDVKDGIRRLVSVGYRVHKLQLHEESEGVETYRVTDWEPYELSIVPIPADPSVGVGRNTNPEPQDPPMPDKPKSDNAAQQRSEPTQASPAPAAAPTPEVQVTRYDPRADREAEASRIKEINSRAEMVKTSGARDLAQKAIIDGLTPDEFSHRLLTEELKARPATLAPTVGMSNREADAYSFTKAIREASEGKLSGLEAEAHTAEAKRSGRTAKGFFIPTDVIVQQRNLNTRTLTSGAFTSGGALVATEIVTSSFIDLLRNKAMCVQLGATSIGNLVGDIAIPKLSGGATAYWLSETGTVTKSTPTTGQLVGVPKRLAGYSAISKTLLTQASLDAETLVRTDLARALALAKDLAAIAGAGGSEPTGILNMSTTDGIGEVTFGAAATFAKMVEFETTLSTANGDQGRLAYLTTPGTRGKLKTKDVGTDTGTMVWTAAGVNGYRAEATNQVTGNKVIFGNWEDLVFFDWAGLDVTVDPYTLAADGQLRVITTMLCDIGVRHGASFVRSTDSGAQ